MLKSKIQAARITSKEHMRKSAIDEDGSADIAMVNRSMPQCYQWTAPDYLRHPRSQRVRNNIR